MTYISSGKIKTVAILGAVLGLIRYQQEKEKKYLLDKNIDISSYQPILKQRKAIVDKISDYLKGLEHSIPDDRFKPKMRKIDKIIDKNMKGRYLDVELIGLGLLEDMIRYSKVKDVGIELELITQTKEMIAQTYEKEKLKVKLESRAIAGKLYEEFF